MSILEVFMDFESGTIYGCVDVMGTPICVTYPAPPSPHETYCLQIASEMKGAAVKTPGFDSASGPYVFGTHFRFNRLNPAPNFSPFQWETGGVMDFHVHLADGGVFKLYDSANSLVATSGAVIQVNKYCVVEMFFTKGSTTGALVLHVDSNEVFNVSNQDFDGGGSGNMQIQLGGQGGFAASPCTIYLSDVYVGSSASGVDDFLGNFCSLTYRHAVASATPDVGDDLELGTEWVDAADIPFDDANLARYNGSSRKGIVTTDVSDGGAVPGPYGDDRLGDDDIIVGGKWLFRHYRSYTSNGWLHFGATPYGDPGVDNTSSEAMVAGAIRNKSIVKDVTEPEVPDATKYFQWGFRAQALAVSDVRVYDCLCSLLVKVVPSFRGVHLGGGPVGKGEKKEVLIGS